MQLKIRVFFIALFCGYASNAMATTIAPYVHHKNGSSNLVIKTSTTQKKLLKKLRKANPLQSSDKKSSNKTSPHLVLKRLRKIQFERAFLLDDTMATSVWLVVPAMHEFNKQPIPNRWNIFPEELTITRHKNLYVQSPRA